MGIGLILGGIGQGISQAGKTYGDAMMEVAKGDILEQRKLALEEMREESKAKRSILETEKAQAVAKDIASERKAAQLEANAQKIASVTPSMDAEQIKQLMQDNPEYVKSFQKSGLIAGEPTRNQQRMQEAEDLYAGARKIGASAKTLESIDAQRKRTLEEIRIENKDQAEAQHRAQNERRLDIMEKGINARVAASSGGGSLRVSKTIVDDSGDVITVMSDGTTKNTGIKANDFQKQVTNQINLMSKNNYAFSQLTLDEQREKAMEVVVASKKPKPSDNATPAPDKQNTPAQPVINELPKGSVPIGMSGGKQVYQTPGGKRIIAK